MIEELQTARATILNIAWKYKGLPSSKYRGIDSGISPETGFTCNGLMLAILREAKKHLPHLELPENVVHASEMFDHLGVLVHPSLAKPGDLVFSCRPSGLKPTHVEMYLYNNRIGEPYAISSPGRDGTVVGFAPIKEKVLAVTSEFQIYSQDPIGYKRLTLKIDHDRWSHIPIF